MKYLILFCCYLFSLSGLAQQYSIDWHKIAGGGGAGTNGQYSLLGTIGQHDASATARGGNEAVTGGFWALYTVQSPGAPLLTITYANNQAIVSWSPLVTGWTLQTNGNLGTTNWANYGGPIGNNSVTNSPPSGSLFFRLVNP